MNIREISKPVTAKSLNESLAKKFGQKLNLEAFTLEQLQDTRNKIRTKLSQVETNESFDTVHRSEGYQKSKLFLDILNAEISERSDVDEGKKKAKPDFLDVDGDGNKKEPMKKALKDKKKKKIGEADAQPNENDPAYVAIKKKYEEAFRTGNRAMGRLLAGLLRDVYGEDPTVGGMIGQRTGTAANQGNAQPAGMQGAVSDSMEESVVTEGAEDEAELVMAAKDMVDRVTGWMEDTAEMQTESMLELADAIRDELGSEKSEAFTAAIKPALESLYSAMEATRGTLTQGVGMLTGEADAPMMGDELPPMDDEAPMEPVDDALPGDETDDFDAAAPAAGGEDEAGRARRESVERTSKKKLAERSRKIGTILSKKKS